MEVVALAHPVTRESDGCPQAQPSDPDDVTRHAEGVAQDAHGVRVLHHQGAGVLGNVQGVGDGKVDEMSRSPMPRAPIYILVSFPGRKPTTPRDDGLGARASAPRARVGKDAGTE